MVEDIQWKYLLAIVILAGLGILFTVLSRSGEMKEQDQLKKFISREYETHPKMLPQDLYKFLHQAAMGSEHAVKDTNSAINWMKNEIAGLDMNVENSMIDTLSANGNMVRVNLRPFIKAGYSTNKLLRAFIGTANNYTENNEALINYLSTARKMIKRKELNLSLAEFNKFSKDMESKGFPAVHHSSAYEAEYKPAYRVISSEYLPDLIKK